MILYYFQNTWWEPRNTLCLISSPLHLPPQTLVEPNPIHFLISFAETPTSLTFAKADSNGDTIARYDQSNIIHKKNTASQVPENSGSIDSTGVLGPRKTLYSI